MTRTPPTRRFRSWHWISAAATVGLITVVAFLVRQGNPSRPAAAQQRRPAGSSQRPTARPANEKNVAPQQAARRRPARPQHGSIPSVVAVVNDHRITKAQLGQACLWRYGEDVLDSIINKQLIAEECRKQRIEVTEQDVEAEIARVAKKFGMSPDRWLALLKNERDIHPAQYRREIIWPTISLRRLAAAQINVSPGEIRNAFESEFGPKVQVRLISVKSRSKAEKVHAEAAKNPAAFAKLARDYSEDPSASAMGMVAPIRRHMGVPQIEDAAFRLKANEISPIVSVDDRYVILKCERHIPPTYIADRFRKDAENRIADRLRDEKLRFAAARLFKEMQSTAKVTTIYNDPQLKQKAPGVAAMINGRSIPMSALIEECIVRYGPEVLEGEINRVLLTQELKRARKTVTQQDIDAEVARAAVSYGFIKADGSADVDKWLAKVQEQDGATLELYVQDVVWPTAALKKLVGTKISVSEDELKRAFESNYGPRVEALAIVVGNQRTAQKVWEMARGNPTDQFFGELARQYSIDPISRANQGRIPPIRRYGGRPMLEQEAFGLKPGEMSGIIASGDQYVILRCIGLTQPVVRSMDAEVRDELLRDIKERKLRRMMADRFEALRDHAHIENYLRGTVETPKAKQAQRRQGAPRR